jgi:hypothetical protein
VSYGGSGSTALPRAGARGTIQAALAGTITIGAVLLALLTLYAVFLDQGQLLSPVLGKVAVSANYLHEFAHDGRHLLGAPCH